MSSAAYRSDRLASAIESRHSLAARAPVGDSRVRSGLPQLDPCSASAAWLAPSPVDPEPLVRIEAADRCPAYSGAKALRRCHDVRSELLSGYPDESLDVRIGQRSDRRERLDSGEEQDFGLEHVPDARHHALIQQDI